LGELVSFYRALGLNVIPIKPNSKEPLLPWKEFQKRKLTDAEIHRHFTEGVNIGIVCGGISNNLVVLDFDDMEVFNKIRKYLPETLTIKTAHNNRQLYYRTDFPIRKSRITQLRIDIQGEGSYVVAPPSKIEGDLTYEFTIQQPIAHWDGDFEFELQEILHKVFKIKPRPYDISRILQGVPEGERDESGIRLASWYRRQGKTAEETLELMLEWNRLNKPPLPDKVIEEKVKSAYKHEKPYGYRFIEPKTVKVTSPGEDLKDVIFEQIKTGEYVTLDKKTGTVSKRTFIIAEGKTYTPIDPSPWPLTNEPQSYESLEKLWDEIKQFIYDHVDVSEGYELLTAWALASWVPEKWRSVPYLFFYGPAGSGKTWALEVLASICLRGLLSPSVTPAVLFRLCDTWRPTVFLDETEIYLKEEKAAILHLLNAGYRKGQYTIRTGEPDKTGERKLQFFKVFGFKAMAGTKEFAETLKSRSIVFNMSKATRPVKMEIDPERAEQLRSKLLMYRFNQLLGKEVSENYRFPEGSHISGRVKELFIPLITVAPEDVKQQIIESAEDTMKSREQEEQASIEAIVFNAVVEAYKEHGKERKVSIQDIANCANFSLPEREQLSSQTVGYITSRLGFKKAMYRRRICIIWDAKLVERLRKRYPIQRDAIMDEFDREA
jgi:hypothetical protein